MQLLKKGDKCPCCGQPIVTDDPHRLYLLNQMRVWMDHRSGRISQNEAYRQSTELILRYSGLED